MTQLNITAVIIVSVPVLAILASFELFIQNHSVLLCRGFINAAEAKLKAELKSTYLTQLDKKRLTMCKQELVGKTCTRTKSTVFLWILKTCMVVNQ